MKMNEQKAHSEMTHSFRSLLPPHKMPNVFMTIVDEKFETSMGNIKMHRAQQMSKQMIA